jgi:uncharacterized protein
MDFTRYNSKATEHHRYDEGLRAYMLRIFTLMAIGLGITGVVAFFAGTSQSFLQLLFTQGVNGHVSMSGLGWLISLAPLAFVLIFSFGFAKMSTEMANMLFWAFSVLMGLSLSVLFLQYTGTSIARTFFITSSVFAAMSIYGYTTHKDLTALGSFLFMGLIGIIVVSLVNMFLQSSALQFVTSFVGVFIFIGLTAYDVQRLKNIYYQAPTVDTTMINKIAIMGALTLYMDFINLFIMLLQFFGNRRN